MSILRDIRIGLQVNPALTFPFPTGPDRGQRIEVAPGVHWLRMPLPMALDHINVWSIEDGDGWALVDTGARNEDTVRIWGEMLSGSTCRGPITRVFVTHMHPDHVGMAGWITRKFGVQLWMSRLEYLTCRIMVSDTGREAPDAAIAFYRRAGWNEAQLEIYRGRFGQFGAMVHALPDSFQRLQDGDRIRIGERDWQVIVGCGHSPEHACLYCPELRLLISGDQVLPRISSNVSVFPTEPAANPLNDWLHSLDKLQREVPADVLVLPAHHDCFHGLHVRIDALRSSLHKALDRLRALLDQPRRVVDVFPALFGRDISESNVLMLGMATGEAVAALNYLIARSEVVCEVGTAGIAHYRRV